MKKKIIIVALIVALIGAVAGFFFTRRGGGKGPDFPKPVEEYTAGEEAVPSITSSVEEGKDELLLSVSTNEQTEEDSEVGNEKKQKEEKPKDNGEVNKKEEKRKEKEQKKKEKEEKKRNKDQQKDGKKAEEEKTDISGTEGTSQTENLEPWNKYYYQSNAYTVDVLEAYAAYLEGEGFEQVQEKEQQSSEKQQAEESVNKTFHAKYQRKSEEEGYLFSVELEYPLANDPAIQMYAVKAMKEKAPAAQGADGEGITRDRAMNYLESLDSTSLGLTKPLSDYYVVMDMGRSYVEGKDCYGINVYDKGAEKESYFVQKYYLSIGDQELYSCDIDGVIRRLQPAKGLAPSGVSVPGTAGNGTATNSQVQDVNTGDIAHDWNFGPPEEKKKE